MFDFRIPDALKAMAIELQEQIRRRERKASGDESLSTGCEALDALFPARGVRRGSLVEWVGEGAASGAGTVSLIAGWRVCQADRPLVLIDPRRHASPLALKALDFDLARLVFVRPKSERETLWACEEALRCDGVGLVWAEVEQLSATAFRRLRLAAEASAGVGFLLRSAKALRHSSWAEVRLCVQPRPSLEASPRFRVDVVYSQGRPVRSRTEIMIDFSQGTIHEVSRPIATSVVSVVS